MRDRYALVLRKRSERAAIPSAVAVATSRCSPEMRELVSLAIRGCRGEVWKPMKADSAVHARPRESLSRGDTHRGAPASPPGAREETRGSRLRPGKRPGSERRPKRTNAEPMAQVAPRGPATPPRARPSLRGSRSGTNGPSQRHLGEETA